MATFFMFGKYTPDSVKAIDVGRTKAAVDEIKRLGGEVNGMHALLGPYDLLFCVTLPGVEDAIKASVVLSRMTGISFSSCPAVAIEVFDRLASEK